MLFSTRHYGLILILIQSFKALRDVTCDSRWISKKAKTLLYIVTISDVSVKRPPTFISQFLVVVDERSVVSFETKEWR